MLHRLEAILRVGDQDAREQLQGVEPCTGGAGPPVDGPAACVSGFTL
jgi:hypothetical protein